MVFDPEFQEFKRVSYGDGEFLIPHRVLRVGHHPGADQSGLRHRDSDIRVTSDNFRVVVDFFTGFAVMVVVVIFGGGGGGGGEGFNAGFTEGEAAAETFRS